MRTLCSVGFGLFVSAAFFVAGGAAAPSGDTCAVTGSGTTYTVVVNLPSNAAEQGAFAFGAPGGVTTSVVAAQSSPGSVLTTGLPASTTSALATEAVPGSSVTASLTTSAAVTGSLTVVPGNSDHTTWFDPIACQSSGTSVASSNFTLQKTANYNATTGLWDELVSVPGSGKLIYAQRTTVTKGIPRPLIGSGNVTASKSGTVTLALKATPSGIAQLKKTGVLKLSLSIEFTPRGGRPVDKTVTLTLRK
jgi:hypothetical protein